MPNGDRIGDDDVVSSPEFVEIYRSGFRTTPEPVGVVTPDGRVVDLNASAERLLWYPRKDVLGRTMEDLGWWVDPDERESCREQVLRTGTVVRPVRLRRRDGAVRDVYVAATLVEVGARRFVFWIARDVTGQPLSDIEATRLEEELRESMAERRRLVVRLVHAAEQEGARLADELRAGPIQQLTASQLSLEVARGGLDAAQREALGRVEASIAEAIGDLRRLSFELRPPVLERDGLGVAVRSLLREFEQSYGLSVDLDDRTGAGVPSGDTSAVAYRVILDSLIAVRDLGGADRVAVSLELRDTDLCVSISVEGMPFDEAHPPTLEALGLETVHDLLSSVGGSVELRTTASETIITSIVPEVLP
jgi:two-component system NarL family sensor kinase